MSEKSTKLAYIYASAKLFIIRFNFISTTKVGIENFLTPTTVVWELNYGPDTMNPVTVEDKVFEDMIDKIGKDLEIKDIKGDTKVDSNGSPLTTT